MGVTYSINLKRRVILLETTKLMIEEMKIQLNYLNLPIYDILKNFEDKAYFDKLSFIVQCSHRIEKGDDFRMAWQNAINSSSLPYKIDEKERLLHLGMNLGISDTKNQLIILDLNSSYFDEYILKAKAYEKKYGNLVASLSTLFGCVIFILML